MTMSFLKSKMKEYTLLRNSLGIPLGERGLWLRNYVDYLEDNHLKSPLTAKDAIAWAIMDPSHSIATQHCRLSLVRGFLRHLKASVPETEIPELRFLAKRKRPTPYVLSALELKRLMKAASLNKRYEYLIAPLTLQTIIGLMSCCGLRAGEIVRLKVADLSLDHEPPRLLIRESKFKKTRWVPLHYTVYNRLIDYLEWRHQNGILGFSDHLFVCNDGKSIHYQRLRKRFSELVQQLKFVRKPGQQSLTLHSLRHTFAVRRVRQWYAWKMDTQRLVTLLSVYMGHKSIECSYWYLSATPELMNAASDLFETYTKQGGTI